MVSGAPPLSSTARGDNTPRLTQLLANHLGILVGVDVHCALGKRVVLALPAGLPVGQHVVEHEPVAIPDALGGQLAALDQTTTVGRLTPRRSAACWVVSVMLCGAMVTALPACSAATTCLSA